MWRSGKGGVHASKCSIFHGKKNHCFTDTALRVKFPQRSEKLVSCSTEIHSFIFIVQFFREIIALYDVNS